MYIVQKLLSLGRKARGGQRFTKNVDRILIHWIGPYPGQAVTTPWNWWENGSDGKGIVASAHLIVKDENVLQALPLNEIGYHSGDARNNHSIGIEVIPKNAAGEFSEKTLKTLQELVRHIRKETGLDLFLERHFDGVQKKDCPRFYTPVTDLVGVDGRVENPEGGDQRWENLVAFLNNGTAEEKTAQSVSTNIPPDNANIAQSDTNAQNGDYWLNPSNNKWMLLANGKWNYI